MNLFYKICPSCSKHLPFDVFSYSGKIFRCPKCGELLADDPKRNWIGFFLIMLGFTSAALVRHFLRTSLISGMLIITFSFVIWLFFKRLMIVKKDLVIKNKETNEISYIDHSDWEEILSNAAGKENPFEITEYL